MGYALFSVTSKKSSAGVRTGIERGLKPKFNDYLIYSKMPVVISKWIGGETDSYLIEHGLMVKEEQLKKFKEDLRRLRWKKHGQIINLMVSKLPILDDIVENGTIKENYEEAKEFFAYFFLFTGHLERFTELFYEDLQRLNISQELYFDLITLDKEAYTFSIIKDFGKMEYSDLLHKHPFLRTFKDKVKIESIDFKNKVSKRMIALEKVKELLNEQDYNEIRKKSDLINILQYIIEAKNYYLDKIEKMIYKKIEAGDSGWVYK